MRELIPQGVIRAFPRHDNAIRVKGIAFRKRPMPTLGRLLITGSFIGLSVGRELETLEQRRLV
jgi:hypothetical protein